MDSELVNNSNQVNFQLPEAVKDVQPINGITNGNKQQDASEFNELIEKCNQQCRLLSEERKRIETAMRINMKLNNEQDDLTKSLSLITGLTIGDDNQCKSNPLIEDSESPKQSFDRPVFTNCDVGVNLQIASRGFDQRPIDYLLRDMLKEHGAINALLTMIKSAKGEAMDQDEQESLALTLNHLDDSLRQWLQAITLFPFIQYQLKTSNNQEDIIITRLFPVLISITEKIRSLRTILWLASIY